MFMKKNQILLYITLFLAILFLLWWLGINLLKLNGSNNYTDIFPVIALIGGIGGLFVAKKWGFFKSRLGAALSFFSIGLMLQFFGSFIYTLYFRIGGIELAYPSVGDIPYLTTSVLYVVAVYYLSKVIVVRGSIFKPIGVLITAIIMTIVLATVLYFSFLNIAIQDPRGAIYSIVNAAYPVIQAFYFLIGIIALLQARRMAGGKMLLSVSLLLVALIVQYAADFSFLYQAYHNTYQPAGSSDLLYTIAYGLMAFAILMIDRVRDSLVSKPSSKQMTNDSSVGSNQATPLGQGDNGAQQGGNNG
jgi:hypothetical protein